MRKEEMTVTTMEVSEIWITSALRAASRDYILRSTNAIAGSHTWLLKALPKTQAAQLSFAIFLTVGCCQVSAKGSSEPKLTHLQGYCQAFCPSVVGSATVLPLGVVHFTVFNPLDSCSRTHLVKSVESLRCHDAQCSDAIDWQQTLAASLACLLSAAVAPPRPRG